MQSTIPLEELQALKTQLHSVLDGIPLRIRCSFKEERLIILGQHQAETSLDANQTLQFLERKIQSLQLKFTQQVRLYLRIVGQLQPYACRDFKIQPPLPPNPKLQGVGETTKEQPWILPDAELDSLMGELVAFPTASNNSLTTVGASLVKRFTEEPLYRGSSLILMKQMSASLGQWKHWELPLNPKIMLATGATATGLAGAIYTLTRPCVMGNCTELQAAQTLNQRSLQLLQPTVTPENLANAQQQLQQAVALLETIPIWSGQSRNAQTLKHHYQQQEQFLEQLRSLDRGVAIALEKNQNPPHPMDQWQEIQTVWQEAIRQLQALSPHKEFAPVVQQKLQTYRTHLAETERRLQQEQVAQHTLTTVRETIQLATTREQQAHSLEDWQLVRATWQVVILRLQDIAPDTTVAVEVKRLMAAYQGKPTLIAERIEQEQAADVKVQQAIRQAQVAQIAEQEFRWQQAIAAWGTAIHYAQEIPVETSYHGQAATMIRSYNIALTQAQQKLQATTQISTEFNRICTSELNICRLLSVGNAIQVQLTPPYVEAIETARDSGNYNLQALVTDHQLILKHSLERAAHQFQLPVEVYDPSSRMLDRHLP